MAHVEHFSEIMNVVFNEAIDLFLTIILTWEAEKKMVLTKYVCPSCNCRGSVSRVATASI